MRRKFHLTHEFGRFQTGNWLKTRSARRVRRKMGRLTERQQLSQAIKTYVPTAYPLHTQALLTVFCHVTSFNPNFQDVSVRDRELVHPRPIRGEPSSDSLPRPIEHANSRRTPAVRKRLRPTHRRLLDPHPAPGRETMGGLLRHPTLRRKLRG